MADIAVDRIETYRGSDGQISRAVINTNSGIATTHLIPVSSTRELRVLASDDNVVDRSVAIGDLMRRRLQSRAAITFRSVLKTSVHETVCQAI